MSRLKGFAASLAQESGRSVEVIDYGLKVLVYNLAGLAAVILVGYVLRVLPYTMAAYIAAGTLRMTSGGAHTVTPVRCIALTSLQFGAVGLLAFHAGPLCAGTALQIGSVTVLLWVLFAILRYAPRDVPNKPISKQRGRKLRKWAVAVWCVWAALILWAHLAGIPAGLVPAALLGLGVQSLSLLPATQAKACRTES